MSRWFRFYDDALNDKKVQRLAPNLFKTWINLLCLASKGNGKIPSDDDISFELRISVTDAKQQLEDLILAGLVDIRADGTREPHNWQERQFLSDSSAERTRKYRERLKKKSRDVTVTGVVTPPESYTDTDTESYGLLSSSTATRASANDQKFKNGFGKRNDWTIERLASRAEGLGLSVAELTETCNRHKARNRPAYFTKLCIEQLSEKLPGVDQEVIRAALWDKSTDAYVRVMQLLVVAA